MNISITSQSQRVIDERVRSGQYDSAEQVVEEALQLLASRDQLEAANVERLRHLAEEGLAEADRGECTPWDFEATRKRLHEEFAKRQQGNG